MGVGDGSAVGPGRDYDDLTRALAELDAMAGVTRTLRRRRSSWRLVRTLVSVAGLVTAMAVAVAPDQAMSVLAVGTGPAASRTLPYLDSSDAVATDALGGEGTNWPPLPPDASDGRLLPVVTTTAVGSHRFLHVRPDGSPVSYDPCRPIHYVVNPTGMPLEGGRMIVEALAEISRATGFVFVADGTTDEVAGPGRAALQPDRYPGRWAPVLVSWSDGATDPALAGDVAGMAGSTLVTTTGDTTGRLVTGTMLLDREAITEILARSDGYRQARGIVLHEFGHVIGLDHVEDPEELMIGTSNGHLTLGEGDRQGLAALGAGPCWRDT